MNHSLRMLFAIGAAAAVIGIEPASGAPFASRDSQSLAWLKTADPQRDVAAAIAQGELRFYAVNGAAPGIIPGIDQHRSDKDLVETYGYRMIKGTSDYGDTKLNILAHQYAETYNGILLRYLRTKLVKP